MSVVEGTPETSHVCKRHYWVTWEPGLRVCGMCDLIDDGPKRSIPQSATGRVRRESHDRQECRLCGLLRINVVHEPDPDNAPEGKAYYDAIRTKFHAFLPSGMNLLIDRAPSLSHVP